VQSSYHQAKLQAEANEAMAKDGLIADLTLKLSEVTADELAQRSDIETKRLAMGAEAGKAQLAVQRTRVSQLRAVWALRRSQLEALTVRAGIDGVLQELPVQAGQSVTQGTTLARIAEPGHLKAEVRIPETPASEVQLGQAAVVDTRNGVVPGRVVRIDPASTTEPSRSTSRSTDRFRRARGPTSASTGRSSSSGSTTSSTSAGPRSGRNGARSRSSSSWTEGPRRSAFP
jgi:multidrug resistance efflux pump